MTEDHAIQIAHHAALGKSKIKANRHAWMMLSKAEILAMAEFVDLFLIDVPIPKRGEATIQPKTTSDF